MFSSVSWYDFILAILILVIFYYVVIVAVVYRKDLLDTLRNGLPKKDTALTPVVTKEPELFAGVYDLLEELKQVFKKAIENKYHREELMQALSSRIKNYRQLKDTQFETAVNQHIAQTAQSDCSISLNEDDIKQLW
jgi:hypothetical protein